MIRAICSFRFGLRFSSIGTLACVILAIVVRSGSASVRLTKPHSQEWLCYLGGVATLGRAHDSRNHHSHSRRQDVHGALEDKFQEAPRDGQF